ncbi:hypothetical protein B0H19DRAFT_1060289 [Mycena capillaripes]|nr:hypothetical protein B0H19DRAFT_1060289 [Mycena capillaripes]
MRVEGEGEVGEGGVKMWCNHGACSSCKWWAGRAKELGGGWGTVLAVRRFARIGEQFCRVGDAVSLVQRWSGVISEQGGYRRGACVVSVRGNGTVGGGRRGWGAVPSICRSLYLMGPLLVSRRGWGDGRGGRDGGRQCGRPGADALSSARKGMRGGCDTRRRCAAEGVPAGSRRGGPKRASHYEVRTASVRNPQCKVIEMPGREAHAEDDPYDGSRRGAKKQEKGTSSRPVLVL